MIVLTSIIPFFKQIQKEEGENGRKKITQYTRYLTVLISFYYSGLIAVLLKPYVFDYTLAKAIEIFLILSAGSIVTMWFSELITEKGIGNGIWTNYFYKYYFIFTKELRIIPYSKIRN